MEDDQHSALSDTTCITKRTEDKPSHDASIFVGSLPANVDQGDLSRMLMDHLSEHTQIKSVKVVRDSKGGVCAFVQCLDASSATSLLEHLCTNPPRPFLGRILRYEPARAFRTLLISYRAPIHLYPSNYASGPFKEQSTEMELPTAMRIWKHRDSRFHSILYDAHALKAEESHGRTRPLESGDVFFLHPVRYDEETLRDLATYFGSLESINSIDAPADGQYPIPHNGLRASAMDSRCWVVKWQHRDDCVSALMTLRRVPHLTVTWAHQPLPRPLVFPRQPHHIAGTPSFPFPFQHQRAVPPEFMPPDISLGSHLYSDHTNYQLVRQRYGPQVAMGRGIIHSSRAGGNKQSLRDNVNTTRSESFVQYRQTRGSISPSLQKEIPSKGSGIQDHEHPPSTDLDAQDVSVPQTPALDASSITPATPSSHFPITPATSGTFYDDFAMKSGNFREYDTEKQVDPTTLFVGGLETSGPGAWDEEKVRSVFSGYGGLESIKLVRPISASVGFAFVKFNNVEAPARAVQEEHNRVYEGRALRVQLRDINPPKGGWKFGPGRGKHNFNTNRRYNYRPSINGQDNSTMVTHESGPDFSLEIDNRGGQSAFVSQSGAPLQHNESTSFTPDMGREAPETDRFREWYDDLESPHTPTPSSKGSSTSITCASHTTLPYPLMPNGPYISPPPWMQPYVPNGPYPLPYYPGYSFYPPAAIPQQPAPMVTSPSSDVNGSAVGPLAVWPSGVYGSFVSYPIGPLRVPNVGQGPTQPPLIPNGFIQNEHGTVVAVYQQEALNRYMTGSGESTTVHQPYHSEGTQPPASHRVSHQPGQVSVNSPSFYRASSVQRSQIPFHEEAQPLNAPFDLHRRPTYHQPYHNYTNVARSNQHGNNGTFTRPFTGRSGRGYLQNMSHHGRGQAGRTFGDRNR